MFGSKGPRFHGNIWKSSVVSSVSIVASEDACQCMSEKEIHFIPKILPIQNAPKRPTVLWELAPNPTQHLVCCLIFWWCQIFHWHYLQDEWHLLKERDLALFDTIGFATPPDSNPIDPPPRSYWGEFFASIHDPPPTILPWKMIILRRNVWSWRDTGSTELSVILGGNKLNLICKFKLETSGRSEGSTIRSAKSQQKGRLHFTLQKNQSCCIVHTCNLYPSNVFYPCGIFLAKWEPVFLSKELFGAF